MKIICTNIENCGFTEEYKGEDPPPFCVNCPECGSLAFLYTDKQKCIYKEDYINPDLEKIILEAIIKIQQNETTNEFKKK